VFENVVRDQLERTFGGDAGRAAFAKSEFDRCMDVPEPFIRNVEAASHYQCAQLAMSPAGQQWQMFKDSLQAHFLDRHPDDGTAQEPAIPGWQPPGEINIAVRQTARAQKAERDAGQERER
jgi:hypothetical protein